MAHNKNKMELHWSTCAFHTVDLLLNLNIYATGSKTFWLNDYLWKLHFLCTFFVRVNRLVKLYIFPCILIVFCILNLYDNFCINTVLIFNTNRFSIDKSSHIFFHLQYGFLIVPPYCSFCDVIFFPFFGTAMISILQQISHSE